MRAIEITAPGKPDVLRETERPTPAFGDGEALAGLDFMASVDIYVNESTRHADVILPPTTALESEPSRTWSAPRSRG